MAAIWLPILIFLGGKNVGHNVRSFITLVLKEIRIDVGGMFYNGHADPYKEEIQKLVETNPFYQSLEQGDWYLEPATLEDEIL